MKLLDQRECLHFIWYILPHCPKSGVCYEDKPYLPMISESASRRHIFLLDKTSKVIFG